MKEKVIWKYELLNMGMIEAPKGSKLVHAGLDPRRIPCLWLLVDPSSPTEMFVFKIVMTGQEFEDDIWDHASTFIDGSIVCHILLPRGSI